MSDKYDDIHNLRVQRDMLKKQNEALMKFLKAQEAWEAMMLDDDSVNWVDNMTDEIQEAFMEVQRLRNDAKFK